MSAHVGTLLKREVTGTLMGVDGGYSLHRATFVMEDGELIEIEVVPPVGRWLLQRQTEGCVEFNLSFSGLSGYSVVITDDD